MSEGKHTAGPWRIEPKYSQENTYLLWEADGNYPEDTSVEVMDANARLFEAASDLLAALEKLVELADTYSDEMRKIGRGHYELGEGADSMSVSALARVAIAKAKGEPR